MTGLLLKMFSNVLLTFSTHTLQLIFCRSAIILLTFFASIQACFSMATPSITASRAEEVSHFIDWVIFCMLSIKCGVFCIDRVLSLPRWRGNNKTHAHYNKRWTTLFIRTIFPWIKVLEYIHAGMVPELGYFVALLSNQSALHFSMAYQLLDSSYMFHFKTECVSWAKVVIKVWCQTLWTIIIFCLVYSIHIHFHKGWFHHR